jgi:internalin A
MPLYAVRGTHGRRNAERAIKPIIQPRLCPIQAKTPLNLSEKTLVKPMFGLFTAALLMLAGIPESATADESSAAAALEKLGATITRDESKPRRPVLRVNLARNATDADVKLLLELPGLDWLALDQSQITGDGLKRLKALKTLRHLDINGHLLTRGNLKLIKEIKALQFLGLFGHEVTDASLANLDELDKLQGLTIGYALITEEGYQRITHFKELKELFLLTPNSPASFRQINKLKNLRKLGMQGHDITDSCIEQLKDLTQLEYLDLEMTDVSGKGLGRFKNLQELLLPSSQLSDAGLKELEELKGLRSLDASNTNVTDSGLASLGKLKQLRELKLTSTKVTAAGVEKLRRALPSCRIDGPG